MQLVFGNIIQPLRTENSAKLFSRHERSSVQAIASTCIYLGAPGKAFYAESLALTWTA
jgi:hypothetical protein